MLKIAALCSRYALCTIVAIIPLRPNKFEICGDIWNAAIRADCVLENFSIKLKLDRS